MSVYDEVNSLIKAIYESTQYKKFEETNNKLYENKELLIKVNDFRKQRLVIESKKSKGIKYSKNELKSLQEMYSSLMTNPDVSSFIHAERELSEMILNIYEKLGKALNFDLIFLNK